MRCGLALLLAAAVVVVVTASENGAGRREPRMSMEEREEVMKRLQRDTPICVPSAMTPTGSELPPPLPSSFTTELEMAHQEVTKMKVVYGAEAFDMILNKGVLRYELSEGIVLERPYDTEDIIHYNLVKNESLVIKTDTSCEEEGQGNCDPKKSCKAESTRIMKWRLSEIFGLGEAIGNTGYYGVSGILRWAYQIPIEYHGQRMCRGMMCDLFEACIKSDKDDTTALISYYWSVANWTVDANKDRVPVAIEVISTDKLQPYFTRAVKQRYDFYEFYSNIRPDVDRLEPPADVYCKKRVSQKEPPKNPHFFAYSSEAITPITLFLPDGDNQTTEMEFTISFTHDGYYDWVSKIVMQDYVPWYLAGQESRYEHETRQVQEFNQGLAYFIHKHLDRCSIKPIENITSVGDVVVNNNGTVSLLPPWMFEDLDGPWQYNGIHTARGVDADVWVGQKDLLGFLLHENYVSYYASPLVIDEPVFMKDPSRAAHNLRGPRTRQAASNDRERITKAKPVFVPEDKVPMRLERYLNIVAGLPHLINNIYNYQTQPPYTQSIDISLCYPENAKKRHFLLELPPDSLEQVKGLNDNLLHAAQMSMSDIAVISPLRINREMIDVRDGKTFILFTILPLPTVVGDAPEALVESDLDTAAFLITSAVQDSKLMIVVQLVGVVGSVEPVLVFLQARSIQEVTRNEDNSYIYTTDQGYNSGDMAGLAFGVLLLGVLVGAVVFVLIKQSSDNQGGLPRVTMARKSPLSPSNTISIVSDMTASDI